MSLYNVTSMGCDDDVVFRWTTYDYKHFITTNTMPNVLYSLIGYISANV